MEPASLSGFAGRLAASIRQEDALTDFEAAALDLFRLQFGGNAVYRRWCKAAGLEPDQLSRWQEIPAVPTTGFKEWELTALPPSERVAVFHSSGTTGAGNSRHFHGAESLGLYEASLEAWFAPHLVPECLGPNPAAAPVFVALTPPPHDAPHSSLVHMLARVTRRFGAADSGFCGRRLSSGAWELELASLRRLQEQAIRRGAAVVLLGTAFHFVHLLDSLGESPLPAPLPPGSRVMETGGYKGRSREVPKEQLHREITERLGIPPDHVVCEYGMSELSSQAYDHRIPGGARGASSVGREAPSEAGCDRVFRFPPWARSMVISPETGREVAEGEVGLLRVFDLANVWSVLAIQTEDLAVRRGDGFQWRGRAPAAEARGCSLMPA